MAPRYTRRCHTGLTREATQDVSDSLAEIHKLLLQIANTAFNAGGKRSLLDIFQLRFHRANIRCHTESKFPG